mgnify:CR=1 FL=1|jgi:hypothetical protein
MPLIDLLADPSQFKFESKTKQFGSDRPGGGDSGLPYIQFPIDQSGIDPKFRNYYSTNRTSLDFPIRGGASSFDMQTGTVTPSGDLDKERIKKFLTTDVRGQMFLLKQEGLQLSNPKIQTGDTIFSLRSQKIPGLIQNTKVYNGGKNTLAQVGLEGTGIHFQRNGILPYNPLDKYYKDVVGAEKDMLPKEVQESNRLLVLASLKLRQKSSSNQYTKIGDVSNIVNVNKLGISLNRDILFQYLTGPGSVYGLGTTTIKRAVDSDTSQAIDRDTLPSEVGTGVPMSNLAMTYTKLMEQQRSRIDSDGLITNYGDFRLGIDNFPKNRKLPGSNWDLIDSEKIDFRFFDRRVDKMNSLGVITNTVTSSLAYDLPTDEGTDDIIKFIFECISNDRSAGEDKKGPIVEDTNFLFFRAYLSSITDSNTAQWNGFKYMGRGENFYTYQGFDRSISFSFKIAIGSENELYPTYDKLNWLISQVYPDYAMSTSFMRAPIVKLTIGDYLYRVPGILDSVNVTIDQTSPWEITEGKQVPHILEVAVTFKPILSELPSRSIGGKKGSKIIANNVL